MAWTYSANIRGATGATGPQGTVVDGVSRVGDSFQFYSGSSTVGSPVSLIIDLIDGGSPTSTSLGLIDGGTV